MIFLHHTLSNPLAQQCLRLLELQQGSGVYPPPCDCADKKPVCRVMPNFPSASSLPSQRTYIMAVRTWLSSHTSTPARRLIQRGLSSFTESSATLSKIALNSRNSLSGPTVLTASDIAAVASMLL